MMDHAHAVWPRARAAWSTWLRLRPPIDVPDLPSIAAIHLGTRQVMLDAQRLRDTGLDDAVEALLAHEVGHHVVAPRTLEVATRLRVMERCVLGEHAGHRVNLFTDLIVNERLERYAPTLARVYRALVPSGDVLLDPVLGLCLATYEELWGLDHGAILGADLHALEDAHPNLRAQAMRMSEELFLVGPNLFTQQLLFLSIARRFEGQSRDEPFRCLDGEGGDVEAVGASVRANAREEEAVRRAREEGWFDDDDLAQTLDPSHRLDVLGDAWTREAVGAWYRREAERWMPDMPAGKGMIDPVVPVACTDWEPGMSLGRVDWAATLRARGARLGRAAPMVRQHEGEDPGHTPAVVWPKLELWVDVSGSMPDPSRQLNAMTLSATVLLLAASRAGAACRVCLFGDRLLEDHDWTRSEVRLCEQVVGYQGASTRVPFWRMRESMNASRDQPLRVVISDGDFDTHYANSALGRTVVARAAPTLVLVLHGGDPDWAAHYEAAGATVVSVDDPDDLPTVTASLAAALFAS